MSYVITIERPDGKLPLTSKDFLNLVDSDDSLSKASANATKWIHPDTKQEFYIVMESNHLWSDGVTSDKTEDFLKKLRDIASRLDARVYGEEGEDLTDPTLQEPLDSKRFMTGVAGLVLALLLAIPMGVLLILRLPWILWKIRRATK